MLFLWVSPGFEALDTQRSAFLDFMLEQALLLAPPLFSFLILAASGTLEARRRLLVTSILLPSQIA